MWIITNIGGIVTVTAFHIIVTTNSNYCISSPTSNNMVIMTITVADSIVMNCIIDSSY